MFTWNSFSKLDVLRFGGSETLLCSNLTLTKPTIPLPVTVLAKLSVNIHAQTKVNAGILCFTNICLMKNIQSITQKAEDIPPLLPAKIQRAVHQTNPQSLKQAVHSELMLDGRRKESNICQASSAI